MFVPFFRAPFFFSYIQQQLYIVKLERVNIHRIPYNEINTSPGSSVTLIKQTFSFCSAVLSDLINCAKACHCSNGRESGARLHVTDCWENIFILRSARFISVQAMDLIQEFITKLQMQSLFVFWHQRGPRKWIGRSGQIGTTHTGPARRNSQM